ncbi:MAG TPA: tetraacyldisaccharide 4'-kinase, partial [bacterium]|nr:tetraacyldisaccharide 4'-kinase [bacterium]
MAFFAERWPAGLLWPLSRLYGRAVNRRNRRYDSGAAPIWRLECPVISVGNIVTGGTGKTPTVIFLARWLQKRGKRICILSRGYRRRSRGRVLVSDGERIQVTAAEAGDEPLLLAQQLPGVAVVVEADRVAAGRWALGMLGPDIILLDDGFQHRRLHRDLDIVTFKGLQDFGNGWLLPAGPLREDLAGLNRADLLWFNGPAAALRTGPLEAWQEKPQVEAGLAITGCNNMENRALEKTEGVRAILFCGLADPEGFLQTARMTGLQIVRFFRYPDHHAYRYRDILEL